MLNDKQLEDMKRKGRLMQKAEFGNEDLGPLKFLPGSWKSLHGRGWNMIAIPFAEERLNYRLLVNQYNETLDFTFIDSGVPNRGITRNPDVEQSDQFVVTLDYQQKVTQIAADDFPHSGQAGEPDTDIHHEPGLFLHMTNEITNGIDIARLATIPHGDSALALGKSVVIDGPPEIPDISGLPIGVPQDLDHPYLSPYKHFQENLFQNLFDPVRPNDLLKAANAGVNIRQTTALELDTKVETGGIVNIPFIVKQANATEMVSTFWIQELSELSEKGQPKLRLQYSQTVMLDFFPRRDGVEGLIKWPHVSINTLERAD